MGPSRYVTPYLLYFFDGTYGGLAVINKEQTAGTGSPVKLSEPTLHAAVYLCRSVACL